MIKLMEIANQILLFFGNNIAIVSFLGAIIGGEETLVFLTILATKDLLNVWHVLIFFYFGIIISDSIWYGVGKSKIFDWLIKKKYISNTYYYWGLLLDKATKGNDIQALLVTKFLYGFRIPTIMYLARERDCLLDIF